MNKGTRKNIISSIITLLILLAGLFGFRKLSDQKKSTLDNNFVKKETRKVDISYFDLSKEDNEIELDGRLNAYERVVISSKVTGIMEQTSADVREGKYFKKGDLLYSIDNQEAIFNLQAQKSALFTSITQMMPDLKFDYPDAFSKWEKYLKSYEIEGSILPLPEPSTDQEKYFVAGRNILNQYYNIKSQETRLREYKIYAPFSGVVTLSNVFPGSIINPGSPLATMINTSVYEMSAPVPLDQLKYIKTGQSVTLSSRELGKTWTGKVHRIGNQIDASTQNIPVYITVSGRSLKEGMYLNGSIRGSSLDDVTKLPKDIFVNPSTVYVVQDSIIKLKQIESVKRLNDHVVVRGITKEDAIVTGSLAGLYEGQKVTY